MEENICDFLSSELTEAEYFNLSKEDLVNLREFLLKLEEKDEKFLKLIKEPVDSMKGKCNWVSDVAFHALQKEPKGEYILSSIWLLPTDVHNVIARFDEKRERYVELAERIPFVYRASKNVRTLIKRQEELDLIQDELHEIDQVGKNYYDGLLCRKESISKNFSVIYFPNVGMSIWSNGDLLANYYRRQIKEYDKPYLNEENKDKVLSKIQIKKPYNF